MEAKFNDKQMYEILDLIYRTKDREGLHVFVKDVFGLHLERKSFCVGHCAPFDFFSDVFFGETVDGEPVTDVIYIANRTSGKTLIFALLNTINSYYFPDCETASLGAIEAQALKCYNYFKKWCDNVGIVKRIVVSVLQSMSKFTNGSFTQILTATLSGVNSPHPQKSQIDEVELIPWAILQEAFSMAISKQLPDGRIINAQTILTSSRKFAHGSMERLLKEARQRGFKVYMTCVVETVAKHDPVQCAGSVFEEDCQGRCQEYEGHLLIQDVIKTKQRLDRNTWRAQWRSQKPSPEGLVYPMFDINRHQKRVYPDLTKPVDLAEDFGFAEGHADVVGFFQKDITGKKKMIAAIWIEKMVDEQIIILVARKLIELGFINLESLPELKQLIDGSMNDYLELLKIHDKYKNFFNAIVNSWACPPEEPSKISIRGYHGYNVISQNDPAIRRITYGIPLIRRDLEQELLEIDTENVPPEVIEEMGTYPNKYNRMDGTYSDEPEKINDNAPDMVRYYYINNEPNINTQSFGSTKDKPEHRSGLAGIAKQTF